MLLDVNREAHIQSKNHQKLIDDKAKLEKQQKNLDQNLKLSESLISQRKAILESLKYESTMVKDTIVEVEDVDILNWRQKGYMDSEESGSDDSDYTGSQQPSNTEPASAQ